MILCNRLEVGVSGEEAARRLEEVGAGLEELGELRSRTGQITIAILVVQDLAVVPMMLIVGSFGGQGGTAVEVSIKVALSVGFLALLVLVGFSLFLTVRLTSLLED